MMNHQDEAAAVLRDLVGRIRALDGENAEIARQLREVYLEAKAASFNVKAIKQIARSGTAQSDADDTRAYLEALGGDVLPRERGLRHGPVRHRSLAVRNDAGRFRG
jgi:uncharacterized protein (UPF0335 family)